MPAQSAALVGKTFAIFVKDFRLEWRNRYAINIILMFAVTTLAIISFALGQSGLEPKVLAALYWIVVFFSAMAGLSQVFVREEETGTALALRLTADPTAVFLGKFLINLVLLLFITVIVTPLFFILTDAVIIRPWAFLAVLSLGLFCLCSATTLVAAIIAKAASKGALFSVLSLPLLIVLLIMLVSGSTKVMDDASFGNTSLEIQGLVAYGVVMMTSSLMLFKFVWKD